jgi:hypothetical protein
MIPFFFPSLSFLLKKILYCNKQATHQSCKPYTCGKFKLATIQMRDVPNGSSTQKKKAKKLLKDSKLRLLL